MHSLNKLPLSFHSGIDHIKRRYAYCKLVHTNNLYMTLHVGTTSWEWWCVYRLNMLEAGYTSSNFTLTYTHTHIYNSFVAFIGVHEMHRRVGVHLTSTLLNSFTSRPALSNSFFYYMCIIIYTRCYRYSKNKISGSTLDTANIKDWECGLGTRLGGW